MAVLDYSQQVPAAERTLTLLELLGDSPDGLTSAEILDAIGGSRSGLYALLNTLRSRDYLESEGGRHRLGPALWALLPHRPPVLDELLDAFRDETAGSPTGETLALAWPERESIVIVVESPPERVVRAAYRMGSRRPDDGPDALVIRAGEADDTETLREVRRSGMASVSTDELVEIAAPVCRDGVRPTAAVLAGIPSSRASTAALEVVEAGVRSLAARLSYRLGALSYQPYGQATADPVGPTRELDTGELDEFLQGLWGAQLACVRADGTPHVVPLWYEWDGEAIWLAASPGASWRAHIAENPRVSITLDEPWPPLRRAFASGTAIEVDERDIPGGIAGLRRRLAVRYLGAGADRRLELSDADGWVAVKIEPERLHGRQGLGGPDKGRP